MTSHSHGKFATVGDKDEENRTIVLFFLLSPMVNARANVMANLSNVTKLPNTRVFDISPQDGNLQYLKLVGDFRRCYIVLCCDFLRKEKGKYKVTLIKISYLILFRIQHKVVLLACF